MKAILRMICTMEKVFSTKSKQNVISRVSSKRIKRKQVLKSSQMEIYMKVNIKMINFMEEVLSGMGICFILWMMENLQHQQKTIRSSNLHIHMKVKSIIFQLVFVFLLSSTAYIIYALSQLMLKKIYQIKLLL